MTETTHLRIATQSLPWQTQSQGVERMHLAAGIGVLAHDMQLVRLAPGGSLPDAAVGHGIEVLVIDGSWQLAEGQLGKHGYARIPSGHMPNNTSPDGAVLLVRSGPFATGDDQVVHLNSEAQPWLPGQGNLRVQPLHSFAEVGTALVHWPAGERFKPHRHWGGEEIFVLSGTFEDEHGSYPAGTWMLSPHLSCHHPFVNEETIIFVKTGHLAQIPPVT